ncbi:PaaI family thioesterase [Oscillospiraceae bacterium WX1]
MKKKVVRKQNNSSRCFVCGVTNDASLGTEFYELEDGTLAATAVARSFHQSYPGRVHGGVSSALLDETIGRAINITEPDAWGVTVEIITRYKKPVPYDVPLLIIGKITENKRRLFSGEGRLILPDGTVAVTATARYMKMKLSDISAFDGDADVWALFPRDGDPVALEVPDEV